MQCPNCKAKVSKTAKFCPECGTAVPAETSISVKQEVGKVKGTLVGQALDGEQLPPNLKSSTTQKVDSVESGGTVVGTSIGDSQQVGGQRQYGDNITMGDVTGSNIVVGNNNRVSVTHGTSVDELVNAFSILLEKVQALPESPEKTAAQAVVEGLEAEAEKGEEAEEGRVQKWFDFLGDMAPDVWEVAVDTFTNPIKGVSTVFKKVAERAKAGKGK